MESVREKYVTHLGWKEPWAKTNKRGNCERLAKEESAINRGRAGVFEELGYPILELGWFAAEDLGCLRCEKECAKDRIFWIRDIKKRVAMLSHSCRTSEGRGKGERRVMGRGEKTAQIHVRCCVWRNGEQPRRKSSSPQLSQLQPSLDALAHRSCW